MKEYLKRLVWCLLRVRSLFSCDKFLEENRKVSCPKMMCIIPFRKSISMLLPRSILMWAVTATARDCRERAGGVYDLNTFTTDEAIIPTRGGDWYDGGFWQGLFLHDWGIENDAIQATWEYLYKVVMLSNKSLERIDKFSRNPF